MSLLILGACGFAYHKWYKYSVLAKIEHAFEQGDPMLDLHSDSSANFAKFSLARGRDEHWIERAEQAQIDRVLAGEERGHYYLILGEKGSGKEDLLLEGMRRLNGHHISMMEAHSDPEIFRVRLGKAIDFEFSEDFIGQLFSIRGPRESSALLDIERALNKLEKVAVRNKLHPRNGQASGPLVLIINNLHLVKNDANGQQLLELLQQRAELWAESSVVTMIFNSDEYWIYQRLKSLGSKLRIIPVHDLSRAEAVSAMRRFRRSRFGVEEPDSILNRIYDLVGGRMQFVNMVSRSADMLAEVRNLYRMEKTWLLNNTGLIPDFDDDVMDQQKWAGSSFLLAKALVEKQKADLEAAGLSSPLDSGLDDAALRPSLPLYKARHAMTRADFIEGLDALNLFTIDSDGNVKADSVLMMRVLWDLVHEPDFEATLQNVLDRIDQVESLHRTRELTFKEGVPPLDIHASTSSH